MGEKNVIGATLKTPEIKVRCGDCLYFERMASFKEPCIKLGILTKSPPCSRFTADIFQVFVRDEQPVSLRKFKTRNGKHLSALEVLGELSRPDLQRFAALAVAEARSRTRGYYAGQEVYVQVIGDTSDPYVNCFAKAWVLMTTKKHIMVRGADANFNGYYTLDSGSVLTKRKWKKLQKKLVKAGKINAPRTPKLDPKSAGEHEPDPINKIKTVKVKDGSVTLRKGKKK